MRMTTHAATQPPIRIIFWMGVNVKGNISDSDSLDVGENK